MRLQWPIFASLGLDLDEYFLGTINVRIAPFALASLRPLHTFTQVKWCDELPAEDFSFFNTKLRVAGEWYHGLIYYPHPDTKADHKQDPTTIELIMPEIEGVHYGLDVRVESDSTQSALVSPQA